ncbi:MAG TPA: phage holin family protein [Thermomicrobiales bacterium]|nr:phage holin family protein [Thermomicrobiales bacterium]
MEGTSRPEGGRGDPFLPGGNYGRTGRGDASIADLLQEIVGNIQGIVRSEARLLKTEVREEATAAGRAAGMLAGGALLGVYAVGILLLSAVYALRGPVPDWAAALIVGAVVAAVAGVMVKLGLDRIRNVNPLPEQTIDSVKEDVRWVKEHSS